MVRHLSWTGSHDRETGFLKVTFGICLGLAALLALRAAEGVPPITYVPAVRYSATAGELILIDPVEC